MRALVQQYVRLIDQSHGSHKTCDYSACLLLIASKRRSMMPLLCAEMGCPLRRRPGHGISHEAHFKVASPADKAITSPPSLQRLFLRFKRTNWLPSSSTKAGSGTHWPAGKRGPRRPERGENCKKNHTLPPFLLHCAADTLRDKVPGRLACYNKTSSPE
jgi:hypothetical protein